MFGGEKGGMSKKKKMQMMLPIRPIRIQKWKLRKLLWERGN
jgi:hypothetical protein